MVRKCCVPFCRSNKSRKEAYISCFRFPKNEEMKLLWLESIPRKNFIPSEYSSVCVKHFEESDVIKYEKYLQPDGTIKPLLLRCPTLKQGAVPKFFQNSSTNLLKSKKLGSNSRSGTNISRNNTKVKLVSKSNICTGYQHVAVKQEITYKEENEIACLYGGETQSIEDRFDSPQCEPKIIKEELDDDENIIENALKNNSIFIKSEIPEDVDVEMEDEYSLVEQLLQLVNHTEGVEEELTYASDYTTKELKQV